MARKILVEVSDSAFVQLARRAIAARRDLRDEAALTLESAIVRERVSKQKKAAGAETPAASGG